MSYVSDLNKVNRTVENVTFPKTILIDNCNSCNLSCSMCDHKNVSKYRKIQMMDIELYKKIINEIALESPNSRVWQIFFGDPFVLKDMPERIFYAKERGLTDVVLNTNGVLMTKDKAEKVIKAGLDAIYVGVDAATEETYKKIRVKGNFSKTIKNILDYRDLLKSVGLKHQKLFVQFVVSEFNENEVNDFKKFWNDEGVNVKIRPKISWASLIDAKNLQSNDSVERKPCYWLMQTMNICADGRVALCSADIHCRVECGNVTESSLKDVWQKGVLANYRSYQQENKFSSLPQMCYQCQDWQSAYADFSLIDSVSQTIP